MSRAELTSSSWRTSAGRVVRERRSIAAATPATYGVARLVPLKNSSTSPALYAPLPTVSAGGRDEPGPTQVDGIGRPLGHGTVAGLPPALAVAGGTARIGRDAHVQFLGQARAALAVATRRSRRRWRSRTGSRPGAGSRPCCRCWSRPAAPRPAASACSTASRSRHLGLGRRAEAHAGDVGGVVGGVVERVLDSAEVHVPVAAGHLQRHDAASGRHAHGADAVVQGGGNARAAVPCSRRRRRCRRDRRRRHRSRSRSPGAGRHGQCPRPSRWWR